MMFIELFVPKGNLSAQKRRHLCERISNELVRVEGHAPASVIEASLAMTNIVVHEPEQWIAGGRALEPKDAPRFVVRATVPGAWRNEMSEHLIKVITRVLAESDDTPQRFYEEMHAWVHVVGVPEGGMGTLGQAMKASDILKMMTKSYRNAREDGIPQEELPPGTAIDPICGMIAPLTDSDSVKAITLEHNGTVYAFCSHGCRAAFMEEIRGEAAD